MSCSEKIKILLQLVSRKSMKNKKIYPDTLSPAGRHKNVTSKFFAVLKLLLKGGFFSFTLSIHRTSINKFTGHYFVL